MGHRARFRENKHLFLCSAQPEGNLLCMCTRSTTRSFARANDAKIVHSRNAQCNTEEPLYKHRGEGGAGGALAPPLFWLIKLLFQFFSKVLHKKVHRVILCQTCGPQRKHCFFLIAPFRSNIVFWRFSWCLSRQFAEFLVRSRRLDFRLPNNEFQAPVYIFASSWNGVSRRH